jgi:hypothetical protein
MSAAMPARSGAYQETLAFMGIWTGVFGCSDDRYTRMVAGFFDRSHTAERLGYAPSTSGTRRKQDRSPAAWNAAGKCPDRISHDRAGLCEIRVRRIAPG